MKKILITGSSGLIGSVIIKNLGNKYEFSGMDRNPNENYPELKTLITNSNDLNSILPAFKTLIQLFTWLRMFQKLLNGTWY